MASDWIKMRIDLQSHPKVVRILSATATDKFRVIGGLHAVWGVFDTHSEDGRLYGYTPELMDHVIGWPGFSQAMIAVGWMRFDGLEILDMPEFSEHNGQSAKRRAEDQKRKRDGRRGVRTTSAQDADKLRTESGPEKRREEKKEEKTLSVSAAPKPDDVPAEAILAGYRELLPDLSQPRKLDPDRKKKIIARWREDRERQSLDWWRNFWAYVAQSDFLTGRDGKWQSCNLDWLLEPKNMRKVTEGNYENGGNA